MSSPISVATTAANWYVPRDGNELHTIFERHFDDFWAQYNEKYAATYGRYRLDRIQQIGERFRRVATISGEWRYGVFPYHDDYSTAH